jgi:phosphoglycolate phosphatase-like HAD superfamily hydrolase
VRPVVYLFDIDGTLLSTGGAGRRSMDGAFERCHGRADACSSFGFGGMTDRLIARRGLEAIGVPADDAAIHALLATYLGLLEAEIVSAASRIHDGVVAALDRAAARENAAIGLGTGNVEAGARIKLTKVNLWDRFSFGGYGSDHEDRAELLRVGAARGAARLGRTVEQVRVLVIGDTPRDVEAARAIGAECLAVATGAFDQPTLAAAGPTFLVPTLAHPAAEPALFA